MALGSIMHEGEAGTVSISNHVADDADTLEARPVRSPKGFRAKIRAVMAAEAFDPGEPELVHFHSASRLDRLMAILRQPPMRYQNTYVWLLLAASLDVMLTWIVLFLGGEEVNWLADRVIQTHGLRGMIVFKFGLVVFVILMCEFIGRMRDHTGRRLAVWAVVVNFLPVVWTITQLLFVTILGGGAAADDQVLLQIAPVSLLAGRASWNS